MSVEFWKKLFSGKQEGLHWRLSKSFLWHNGKRHVKMWLAKHFWKTNSALNQWKSPCFWHGVNSPWGWKSPKGSTDSSFGGLLMVWLAKQKGSFHFVEDTIYFLIEKSYKNFLTPYCCVLHCLCDTVSSDKKRDLWNRYTSEHHPCLVEIFHLHSAANRYFVLKAF